MKKLISFLSIAVCITACTNHHEQLPILGERQTSTTIVNGGKNTDTIYHTIPNFSFIDQNGQEVTEQTVKDNIYVADFFFTSCPTICPTMKRNLLKVYEKFHTHNDFKILSHTIDPKHDTISVLKRFAQKLNVDHKTWLFLWGERDKVYHLAQTAYLSVVQENKEAPGGFVHSGYLLLVDKNRHIRGAYDGTNDKQVAQLIKDIDLLYEEYQP